MVLNTHQHLVLSDISKAHEKLFAGCALRPVNHARPCFTPVAKASTSSVIFGRFLYDPWLVQCARRANQATYTIHSILRYKRCIANNLVVEIDIHVIFNDTTSIKTVDQVAKQIKPNQNDFKKGYDQVKPDNEILSRLDYDPDSNQFCRLASATKQSFTNNWFLVDATTRVTGLRFWSMLMDSKYSQVFQRVVSSTNIA